MDTRNVSLDLMEFVEQNILPRSVNLQKPITRTSLKLTLNKCLWHVWPLMEIHRMIFPSHHLLLPK